ncbi:MAG TPA: DUF6452 family protein [Aequorivita sp.]|nr:DUF6452 family protein [Aequorivita sp.]
MLKKLIVVLVLVFAFKGCTRDDICPDGTATTPKLLVIFKNVAIPEDRKKVVGLSVETDYENSVLVLGRTETDSIALPLNTNSDTTKYRFIRTTITGIDTVVNIDKVMFLYKRQDLYVNRACGFKAVFNDLASKLEEEPGDGNWIKNVITERTTVNDENKAHIVMLH